MVLPKMAPNSWKPPISVSDFNASIKMMLMLVTLHVDHGRRRGFDVQHNLQVGKLDADG